MLNLNSNFLFLALAFKVAQELMGEERKIVLVDGCYVLRDDQVIVGAGEMMPGLIKSVGQHPQLSAHKNLTLKIGILINLNKMV